MRRLPGWETVVGVAAAVAAYITMPAQAYANVASELVTVLGIVMAAFIPTMLLASTTLRAGRFTPGRIAALSQALDRQISLFGGLFLYALLACAVTIAGKALVWTLPTISFRISSNVVAWDPSRAPEALLSFLLVFLGLRSIALVSGVRSILRLSAKMAIDEAGEIETRLLQAEQAELGRYTLPPRTGEMLDLGNPRVLSR